MMMNIGCILLLFWTSVWSSTHNSLLELLGLAHYLRTTICGLLKNSAWLEIANMGSKRQIPQMVYVHEKPSLFLPKKQPTFSRKDFTNTMCKNGVRLEKTSPGASKGSTTIPLSCRVIQNSISTTSELCSQFRFFYWHATSTIGWRPASSGELGA